MQTLEEIKGKDKLANIPTKLGIQFQHVLDQPIPNTSQEFLEALPKLPFPEDVSVIIKILF